MATEITATSLFSGPDRGLLDNAVLRHDNGVIRSRGRYKGGKMHGKWEFFRRDGSVMRTGEFRDGAQVGIWVTRDKNGRKVKETRF